MKRPSPRAMLFGPFAALLSACGSVTTVPANISEAQGVAEIVASHGRPVPPQDAGRAARGVLEPEDAVLLALANDAALTRSLADLGLAQAGSADARRIRNPVLHLSSLDSSDGGRLVTLGIAASLVDLLTLPARRDAADAEVSAARLSAAAIALEVAARAERAFFAYAGARLSATATRRRAESASLTAELAGQFRDAGNLAPRDHAAMRAVAARTALDAMENELHALEARAALARAMGVPANHDWSVEAVLPGLPARDEALDELLQRAAADHPGIRAVYQQVEASRIRNKLTRWSRWLNDLDVGIEREREPDNARLLGPTLEWSLPLDAPARLIRARAGLQHVLVAYEHARLVVANDIFEARAVLGAARERTELYRDELMPALATVRRSAQEEQNFMLIGVFELIEERNAEYEAQRGYIESLRDYWVARADLALAVGAALPASTDGHLDESSLDLPAAAKGQLHHHHHSQDH